MINSININWGKSNLYIYILSNNVYEFLALWRNDVGRWGRVVQVNDPTTPITALLYIKLNITQVIVSRELRKLCPCVELNFNAFVSCFIVLFLLDSFLKFLKVLVDFLFISYRSFFFNQQIMCIGRMKLALIFFSIEYTQNQPPTKVLWRWNNQPLKR